MSSTDATLKQLNSIIKRAPNMTHQELVKIVSELATLLISKTPKI